MATHLFFTSLLAKIQLLSNKLGLNSDQSFYYDYFCTLDSVSKKDSTKFFQLRLCKILLLGKAAHYTFLWKYQDRLVPSRNILHFNVVAIEHLPPYVCLTIACFGLLCLEYLHFLYFQNKGFTLNILRTLLLENRNAFFLESKYKF